MKKILFFAALSMLALSSCKKDHNDDGENRKVFKGEAQVFQHGKAWSWYEVDDAGNPVRLGIAIDDAAMASLDTSAPGGPGHHHENSLSLKLPAKAGNTPFQHVLLDWNSKGHEPAGIYDTPHFDFHFYTVPDAERKTIPLYEQDSMKFKNLPAPAYMPPTYIALPGGVPQMGVHWLDVTTPEINGQPFTQTFLFGSYDGKVTFYEPMITEAFIKANPNFERAIPQPAKYQKDGWYPTKMRISKENGTTNVIVEAFVKRQAS